MKNLQKGLRIRIIILVLAFVMAGGFYVVVNKNRAPETTMPIFNSDWKTYSDLRYKFEMKYPETWKFIQPSGTDQWAVRFYDSTQNPAPFSDEPADTFFVKTKCDMNANKTWQMSEFNFSYREECVNGFGVVLSAISEESKMTLEKMLSTLKPLK